jgi:hypothetical protein
VSESINRELTDLAVGKIDALLGAARGRVLFDLVLKETGLTAIRHARDLLNFGETLQKHGGVEGAVGSILSFQALLRGAKRRGGVAPRGTTPDES